MNHRVFKRMATAGAFTALAVRCVVVFSADFYFFPGHADWKRAFFADHFFIANLHWLVGFSVAFLLAVQAAQPKTRPAGNQLNWEIFSVAMLRGLFLVLCAGGALEFWSLVVQGKGVRAAAERGNLPDVVFYTRLVPESLQYRYPGGGETSDCGPSGFFREMRPMPSRESGRSLLHLAAQSGNPQLLQYLLDQGFPVNDRDADGLTPLHSAVSFRASETIVRLLLANGADVEARDEQGWTPLFSAVSSSRCLESSRLLLEHGARPTVSDRDGRTPLHYAVESANFKLVDLLLDNNADPTAPDEKGVRPLDLICDRGIHLLFTTRGFELPPFKQYPWK